jgi:hypothetical protein
MVCCNHIAGVNQCCVLGVVFSTVPWFVKSHVIAGFKNNPPTVVFLFGWTRNEAKRNAKSLYLEWFDSDSTIIDWSKFCYSLREKLLGLDVVQICSFSEVIDLCFEKIALRVEQVQRYELTSGIPFYRGDKRCRKKELSIIGCSADVGGVVIIVIECNEFWWSGCHDGGEFRLLHVGVIIFLCSFCEVFPEFAAQERWMERSSKARL